MINAGHLLNAKYQWLFNILWFLASEDTRAEYVNYLDIDETEQMEEQYDSYMANLRSDAINMDIDEFNKKYYPEIDSDEIPF